jgi:integrase
MESRKARITKRTVDAVAVPPEGEEARLWDTDLKGFFLRVYPTGRRVYALKYRLGPLQRIYTIGVHGSPYTPEKAREAAEAALRRVAAGEDPAVTKKEAREALTVAALIDRYLDEGPDTKPHKRASTWQIDRSNLNRHIRPLLGRKVANTVTKADAARAIRDITDGKTAKDEKSEKKRGRAIVRGGEGTARRTRTTAAAMFAWGVEHGYIAANPFAAVKLSAAPVRERFLSRDEAGRLLDALASMEESGDMSRTVGDAIRLLLLTGARKSEIAGLRWAEVDTERKRLVLPPERTKAGGKTGERHITLSPPALEILGRRRPEKAKPDQFVFPAARGNGHVVGIRRPFLKACAAAKVEGFRIHDLRHSFASFLIADGASLFLVGKLLGHASTRTAERYAHLSGDPLQDAAAAVGKKLFPTQEASGGEGGDGSDSSAEVIQLRPGG